MNNIKLFGLDLTPERLRLILAGLFTLLFVYNVWNGTYPSVDQYMAKRTEIEANQQKLDAFKNLLLSREQIEARLTAVKTSLGQIQNRFPPRNQILSILLVDLSEIFRDSGTNMINFEPLGFKPLEQGNLKNLGRMQIKIAARGDYPSTILLFDKLHRYERVLRIESPQIGTPGGGAQVATTEGAPAENAAMSVPEPTAGFNRTLDVSFTLTTYAVNR